MASREEFEDFGPQITNGFPNKIVLASFTGEETQKLFVNNYRMSTSLLTVIQLNRL